MRIAHIASQENGNVKLEINDLRAEWTHLTEALIMAESLLRMFQHKDQAFYVEQFRQLVMQAATAPQMAARQEPYVSTD